jgi:peroxiredoxin
LPNSISVEIKKLTIFLLFTALGAILLLLFVLNYQSEDNGPTSKVSLSVGNLAADFTLPNVQNQPVNLFDELKKGPVIISFYWGGWCPVCNTQLRTYQENLDQIKSFGAQLIAISPDIPTSAQLTMVKNKLDFEILSDQGNDLARKFGIIWEIPLASRESFSNWIQENHGKTLEDFNAQKGYELPIPATFIVNQKGVVIYAFKDVDYKKRAKNKDILKTLSQI